MQISLNLHRLGIAQQVGNSVAKKSVELKVAVAYVPCEAADRYIVILKREIAR